jgi:hypothetical protein
MGQDKPTQLGPLESKTSPIALYNIHHHQNPFKSINNNSHVKGTAAIPPLLLIVMTKSLCYVTLTVLTKGTRMLANKTDELQDRVKEPNYENLMQHYVLGR